MIEIPEQSPQTLSIKLPPTSSIEELITILKLFQQGIDRPIRDLTGDGARLEGFDRGSFWIELAIGAPIAYRIVVKILDIVKRYRVDRLEIDYASEILRTKRIHNDHLQSLQNNAQEVLEQNAELYAGELIKEFVSVENGERDISRFNETRILLTNSIKELDRLIDKGLEIHPALHAPPEIQKLFPKPLTAATVSPAQLSARSESSQSETSAKPDAV